MTEPDEPTGKPDDEKNPPSPYLPEDVVFPESFRKLWRTLLSPWNRR